MLVYLSVHFIEGRKESRVERLITGAPQEAPSLLIVHSLDLTAISFEPSCEFPDLRMASSERIQTDLRNLNRREKIVGCGVLADNDKREDHIYPW